MRRFLLGGAVAALVAALLTVPAPAQAAPPPARAGYRCGGDNTFKVVSTRLVRRPSGSVSVFAEVKNKTRKWRGKVRGTLCFYDASGRVIGSELGYAEHLAVGPGKRVPFVVTDVAPSGWTRWTLALQSRSTKLRPVTRKVTTHAGPAYVDDNGLFHLPVTVRNRNRFKIRHTAVIVTLFDRAGRILSFNEGYNYTHPSVIRPRRTASFDAFAFGQWQGAVRARVQIEAWRRR